MLLLLRRATARGSDRVSWLDPHNFYALQQEGADRRERLRRLALETIDLAKDPYFMRNHLGQYECRLCLTLHNNEGNYLAHTQARRSSLRHRLAHERLRLYVGRIAY